MSLKKLFDVPPYSSCRNETTDFGYDLGPPDGIRLSQTGLLKSGCMILSYKELLIPYRTEFHRVLVFD